MMIIRVFTGLGGDVWASTEGVWLIEIPFRIKLAWKGYLQGLY
jgi:hypothetical protein